MPIGKEQRRSTCDLFELFGNVGQPFVLPEQQFAQSNLARVGFNSNGRVEPSSRRRRKPFGRNAAQKEAKIEEEKISIQE